MQEREASLTCRREHAFGSLGINVSFKATQIIEGYRLGMIISNHSDK